MISATAAKQSAIFWSLGHYYEWPLDKIAERIFRVPYGLLIGDLRRMGFRREEISRLLNNDHPRGWCRTCRAEIAPNMEFCCDECRQKESKIRENILRGYIPVTLSKYGYYDMTRQRYVRVKELDK